jgi:erythronate-4-phosphate dehydrogenase
MKIVVDENIPFADEYFGNLGEVIRVPGRNIPKDALKSADALIIRSVTRVNEELVDCTQSLKYVGTCTIGTDHVDAGLLSDRNIMFQSAPGCNRISVGQYVISSLFLLARRKSFCLKGKSIGIVGGGNTGSSVAFYAELLGMNVRIYDPFLAVADSGSGKNYVSWNDALNSDIVTFHVPLTKDGAYPTWHMLSDDEISALKPGTVLVNASRGDVWNNDALLVRMEKSGDLELVMDVWEHEPKVNVPLIGHTFLSTPHIAGYSAEGKLRGTSMIASGFCRFFGIEQKLPEESGLLSVTDSDFMPSSSDPEKAWGEIALEVYNPERDSKIFRKQYTDPSSFDLMRKNYPGRREWSSKRFSIGDPELKSLLSKAGFGLIL